MLQKERKKVILDPYPDSDQHQVTPCPRCQVWSTSINAFTNYHVDTDTGIIKRIFIYLDEDAFVMLYMSLVKSHLEYANSVWNPHRLALIKDLEKVQMSATKLVISIKNLTYKDRLKRLKLPTLKRRRIRGDMYEVYKS